MIVYKLFRLKNDKLYPLFINRNVETKMNVLLEAGCYPTKNFATRKGWHCCFKPVAPHLKTELASGEKRVWVECTALDCTTYNRPESQGGAWVLAQLLKVNKILTSVEVDHINNNYDGYQCAGHKHNMDCDVCPAFHRCML